MKNRSAIHKGEKLIYETESDIELSIRIKCAFYNCKCFAVLKLVKGGSSFGTYHNQKYGMFDIRNEGFVCDKHQKEYDSHFTKKGYKKTFGLLKFNHTLA